MLELITVISKVTVAETIFRIKNLAFLEESLLQSFFV